MTTYLGDDGLGQLLDASSSTLTVAEVREIVRGVTAAPPSMNPTEWLSLVREEADASLDQQLIALHSLITAESQFGLLFAQNLIAEAWTVSLFLGRMNIRENTCPHAPRVWSG